MNRLLNRISIVMIRGRILILAGFLCLGLIASGGIFAGEAWAGDNQYGADANLRLEGNNDNSNPAGVSEGVVITSNGDTTGDSAGNAKSYIRVMSTNTTGAAAAPNTGYIDIYSPQINIYGPTTMNSTLSVSGTITGYLSGNISGSASYATSAGSAGYVTNAAQGNITSVGTLTGLTINGSGIDNTGDGITNAGAISGATQITATGMDIDSIHISDATSGVNNISGISTLGATTGNITTLNSTTVNSPTLTTGSNLTIRADNDSGNAGTEYVTVGASGVETIRSSSTATSINTSNTANTSIGNATGTVAITGSTNTITGPSNVIQSAASGNSRSLITANTTQASVQYVDATGDSHGLTVNATQTVLSGGTNSSSLTLQDASATLKVGTATTAEVQVLQATNTGGITSVTIGGDSNILNDIKATATNGVNNLTANATSGTNNIEAKTNNIGVATASSINTIGNSTATNTITGASNTIQAGINKIVVTAPSTGTGVLISASTTGEVSTTDGRLVGAVSISGSGGGARLTQTAVTNFIKDVSADKTSDNVFYDFSEKIITDNLTGATYNTSTGVGNWADVAIMSNSGSAGIRINDYGVQIISPPVTGDQVATNDIGTSTGDGTINNIIGGGGTSGGTVNNTIGQGGTNGGTVTNSIGDGGSTSSIVNNTFGSASSNSLGTVTNTIGAAGAGDVTNNIGTGDGISTNNIGNSTLGTTNTITGSAGAGLNSNNMTATTGNNLITSTLGSNTIQGQIGNTIDTNTGNNVINADVGSNLLTGNAGSGNTSNGITATTGNNAISATAGSNTISANAANQSNTISATGTNGINNMTANATTGTNNIEGRNNNIGVTTTPSTNTIGNINTATTVNSYGGAGYTEVKNASSTMGTGDGGLVQTTATTAAIRASDNTHSLATNSNTGTMTVNGGGGYMAYNSEQNTGSNTIGGVVNNKLFTNKINGSLYVDGNVYINGTLDYVSSNSANTTVVGLSTAGSSNLSDASQPVNAGTAIVMKGSTGTQTVVDGNGKLTNVTGTAGESTASLTLTNGVGNTHGVVITETQTTISGGKNSSAMTLHDDGATFSNTSNGLPVRVHGVADGTDDFDAVNYRQLRKAYIGIASVSALSALPALKPGRKFGLGAGYGYFQGSNAVAIGLKAAIWDNLDVSAGVGLGYGESTTTFTTNAGFMYNF